MRKLMYSALLAAVCAWSPGCCDCRSSCGGSSCGCGTECAAAPETVQKLSLESGGVWTLSEASLEKLAGGGELPGRPITIQFTDGGAGFSGCAGVNRYFGKAEVDAGKGRISFGPAGSTMMAGPGLGSEQAFLSMLGRADGFEIENGKLRLTSGGSVLAEFETGKENKQ
ncbi:MAG: META domain-containing protein [Victivallaceae bacterium]|nr:META domain-containing protein [Victivallaceae bacterium]